MSTVAEPFRDAERYIELRKKWAGQSWVDVLLRVNEAIVTPFITLFMLFLNKSDVFAFVSAASMVYKAWREWLEYSELRFKNYEMFFKTMVAGGPFIVTNDPEYMPYVWADGVMRTELRYSKRP
jgi:hypothetical protein